MNNLKIMQRLSQKHNSYNIDSFELYNCITVNQPKVYCCRTRLILMISTKMWMLSLEWQSACIVLSYIITRSGLWEKETSC